MGSVTTRSPEATRRLGRKLGRLLRPGDFVGLIGELGAGKTLFVRGVAEGAGVPADEYVASPTFAIVNLYRRGRLPLQHADWYRIESADELYAIGFHDLVGGDAATVVEWADRVPDASPQERLDVYFEVAGPRSRRILMVARGARAEEIVRHLAEH
jgi:tRNA threonylcarbamoyladenosine biosynthesis protein TsaE